MRSQLGVDVGGTFTDLAFVDEGQNIRVLKSPTTPGDYPRGIEDCVDLLSLSLRETPEQVLGACTQFIHGSTVVTNAVVEGKVAKVGFLVTRGFRDILTLREGGREDCYNLKEHYPPPYVPRYLTLPVMERINSEGGVEIPLDEGDAGDALRTLIEGFKVDAVAVCFLWSIANPAHELRVKEIVARDWPDMTCVISSEVNPIVREYRRAISTVIEASVRPLASGYVHNVDARLASKGHSGTLYLVVSSGSIVAARDAGERGLAMIGSGPAMAPVGARWFASVEEFGAGNLIVTDMGGTSFDVTMVTDGNVARTRESRIGPETLGLSAIDSRSIGAGGGSIAWIDPGGLIHLGPESAGSVPGPACYGLGGERATVTDANVVLGYIDPANFLGGRMTIDRALAESAIKDTVADPLGIDIEEAAFAIWSTVNVNMASAIQDVSIWHGIDPRKYSLVSGGGAGNCHAVALARSMGIDQVLVPKYGGALSAIGGLVADIAADFDGSLFAETKAFDFDGVNGLLERLETNAMDFISRLSSTHDDARVEFYVEARYTYQVWDLPVRLRQGRFHSEQDVMRLVDDFHEAHRIVFGVMEPGQGVECVNWSARAVVPTPKIKLRELASGTTDPSAAATSGRLAYFREAGGLIRANVFRGDALKSGNVVDGAAIIEEATTTIVVPPGARATVTRFGNYLVESHK